MIINTSYLKKHSARIQAEFNLNGFVYLPRFVEGEELAAIQKNTDRILIDEVANMPKSHVFYEDIADKSSLKQLQMLHTHDSFFESCMVGSKGRLQNSGLQSQYS